MRIRIYNAVWISLTSIYHFSNTFNGRCCYFDMILFLSSRCSHWLMEPAGGGGIIFIYRIYLCRLLSLHCINYTTVTINDENIHAS